MGHIRLGHAGDYSRDAGNRSLVRARDASLCSGMTVLLRGLEPVAAIGDPPGDEANRHSRYETPDQGQAQVGPKTKNKEGKPKNLTALDHVLIIGDIAGTC